MKLLFQKTNPPCGRVICLGIWNFLIGWMRKSLAVTLFNAAHGPEQMAIDACPKVLRLSVKSLHHERVENTNLFQCFHVAMNAGE